MRIVPNSRVTLYEDVSITAGRQLVFNTPQMQNVYFTSHELISEASCQMVKKRRGWLRINADPTKVARCNYLSFINPSFDNKRVYALITDYDYINNECVEVTFAIDYFQTWLFDFIMLESFIEREHLSIADKEKEDVNPYNPDLIDLRTPENLPVGRDVEKPYYNIMPTPHADGHRCGDEVTNYFDVTDQLGILLVLSDINFDYMDSQYDSSSGGDAPSKKFAEAITELENANEDCNFYRLSGGMYSTLHNKYTALTHLNQSYKGSAWGNMTPGAGSRVVAPLSYLYFGDQNYTPTGSTVRTIDHILDLLTTADCLDSVVGIYLIPNGIILTSGVNNTMLGSQALAIKLSTPMDLQGSTVRNKKLMLYPYSYVRLMAPNGDAKELRYEEFEDVQTDQAPTTCDILFTMDIYCTPTLMCNPIRYRYSGLNPDSGGMNSNPIDGMVFSQFPNAPYQTDAFKSMLASVSHNIIQNNTVDYSYDIEQMGLDQAKEQMGTVGKVGKIFSDVMEGKFGNIFKDVTEGVTGGVQMDINAERRQNEMAQSQDAYKALTGGTDNAVYNNYQYTKPAFAANQYHLNNAEGSINYNVFNFCDIVALNVSLNPAIRAKYDIYFDNFGYSTGRFGIPRVYNYLHGSQDDDELPSWHELTEEYGEWSHPYITYVKTNNAKITGVMLPVAQAIQNIFDTGCQFVNVGYTPPQNGNNDSTVY